MPEFFWLIIASTAIALLNGTDLNGCFALGNPMNPVYAGELQGCGLAMDVCAFDEDGQLVDPKSFEFLTTLMAALRAEITRARLEV